MTKIMFRVIGVFVSLGILISPITVRAQSGDVVVSPTIIGEGAEYSTLERGLPWDMQQSVPYPDFSTGLAEVNRDTFAPDGDVWSFTSNNPFKLSPTIRLLPFEIPLAQRATKFGDRYPIATAKYKLLSFRMYSSAADNFIVYWFPQPEWTSGKYSAFFEVKPGWNTYVIDLSVYPEWTGSQVGLRLDMLTQGRGGVGLKLDWVRLTDKNLARQPITISWSGVTGTKVEFFLNSEECSSANAIKIGEKSNPGASGSWNWGNQLIQNLAFTGGQQPVYYPLPESIEPGHYWVVVKSTEQNAKCSELDIKAAPILEFSKPSMLSGPDYALTELGDAWDMSSTTDVTLLGNLLSPTFSNGILSATTPASASSGSIPGDPALNLRTGIINTSVYKYATFRMRLEGAQDIARGWVQRYYWWYQIQANYTVTRDLVLYEGWQTYSIDLSKAFIQEGQSWSGYQTQFRFDPHESVTPLHFELDYVMLTGNERNPINQPFEVIYQVANNLDYDTVTFYMDQDRNPSNGRLHLDQLNMDGIADAGPEKVFIPIAMRNANSGLPELKGARATVITQGIVEGAYYLSADVSDGYQTTTWYSDVPIEIVR